MKKNTKCDPKRSSKAANRHREKCSSKVAAKCAYRGNSPMSKALVEAAEAYVESLRGKNPLADRFTTAELNHCASSLKNPASQYQVHNDVREKGRAHKKGNARRQRRPSKYSERKPLATTNSEGCNKASCNTGQTLVNNQRTEITSKQLPRRKTKREAVSNATADAPRFKTARRTRFQVANVTCKKTKQDTTVLATVEAETPEMRRKSPRERNFSDSVHTQYYKCNSKKSLEYTTEKMDIDLLDDVKIRKRKFNSVITRPVSVYGEEICFNSESAETSFGGNETVLSKRLKMDCNGPYEDSSILSRIQNKIKYSPSRNIADKQKSETSSIFVKESNESCVKALQYLMSQGEKPFVDCTIIFNCAALRGNAIEDSAGDIIQASNKKCQLNGCVEAERNPNLLQKNEIADNQIMLKHVLQMEALKSTLPLGPQHEATEDDNENDTQYVSGEYTLNSTTCSNIHSFNSSTEDDTGRSTQTELAYHQYSQPKRCQTVAVYNIDESVTQPAMQAQTEIRSEMHSNEGTSSMFQLLETHWGCFQNLAKKLSAITSRIKLISREASRMHLFGSLFYISSDHKSCDSTESSPLIKDDGMESSNPSTPQMYRSASVVFDGQLTHPNISERNFGRNSSRTLHADLQDEPENVWNATTNDGTTKIASSRIAQNAWDITGYRQYLANHGNHKSKSTYEQRDKFPSPAQEAPCSDDLGRGSNYEYAKNRQTCKACQYNQLVFRAMHSNCAPFGVGDFVVDFSDLIEPNPPIWQVSQSKVLLKYVPFDYKGKIRYRSVNVYGALNAEKLESHIRVPTEVIFKFGSRQIIEIAEDEFFLRTKAFVSHSINESSTFERSFLIYIQSLLSHCLYPSFLSEIYKANDLYFTQNIRNIDEINESYQRKILQEVPLTKELQNNLDTLPFLNVSNLSPDDMKYDCFVCKTGDVCAKLHLSGNPYDRKLLRELSRWNLRYNNAELFVCISCLIKIHLYNQVTHHKYHMFLDFLTLTSNTRKQSPDKGYYDLIDQQMNDEKWMDELFLSLRVVWAKIERLSMKA